MRSQARRKVRSNARENCSDTGPSQGSSEVQRDRDFPHYLTETTRYDRFGRKASMKSTPASPCQREGTPRAATPAGSGYRSKLRRICRWVPVESCPRHHRNTAPLRRRPRSPAWGPSLPGGGFSPSSAPSAFLASSGLLRNMFPRSLRVRRTLDARASDPSGALRRASRDLISATSRSRSPIASATLNRPGIAGGSGVPWV
jgi:hypothetical protein